MWENIGLELLQPLFQARVVVQVVMAVETQGIDEETVTVGMAALQRHRPGRVFPDRRNDDG
jgi:hypothetical protein